MDTGLLNKGLTGLNAGDVLRLRAAAGRHIGVVRGVAWVTQDGDPRDVVLGAGESFRFDRDGLALVMPLGVETKFVLEEGLAAESKKSPRDLLAHAEDFAYFERRARRMRAEAVADAFASFASALMGFWGRVVGHVSAAMAKRRTAHALRGLSDHILKDIGLRRDQIGCIARRVPC